MVKLYVVVQDMYEIPVIRVAGDDLTGVSWREAKKELRQWFLSRASDLRHVTEKDYFSYLDAPNYSEMVFDPELTHESEV